MLPDNLGYIFQDALRLHPTSEVLIQDDVRLTYSTLDQNCTRVAKGLRELGVGAGDRVALLFGNHYRYIETLLGCMRLKAIGVPLNARLSDEALLYIISDMKPRFSSLVRRCSKRDCGWLPNLFKCALWSILPPAMDIFPMTR